VVKMKPRFLDVLVNPNAFFQETMQENINLKIPGIIILIAAVIGAVYGYIYGGLTAELMSTVMPGLGTIILAFAVIAAFVSVFVFWIIWTGVIFLFSAAFKGKGTFKRCLEFVGYGYIPQIFGSLISIIIALEYIPKVIIPHITQATLQDPQLMQDALKSFTHDPAMLEFTQISTIVTIVFLLWSANIWIFAIRHSRELSARDAVICVMVPVIAFILYLVYNLTVM
jgi:hypothetical protein